MCSKMDEQTDKREKVTSTNRRNNKPLMEKRRRQRINDCLVQLKGLVLQAMNKDTTQYSKLEKADILEMTVKHLKIVQRGQMNAAVATDPNVISKYRAGFNDCASEISRYLDAVNPDLKSRVMGYLGNSMMQFPVIPVYQGVVAPYHVQMTPGMTPQHGFPTSNFPPQMNTTDVTRPPFPQHQSVNTAHPPHSVLSSKRDAYMHHQRLPSPMKAEQVNSLDLSPPRASTHLTSPVRHVPSPCDSDSGLSDSSMSFSHDENGNYSHYNVNGRLRNNSRSEPEEARVSGPTDLRIPGPTDLRKDTLEHCSTDNRLSPKRKHDSCDLISPPKKRVKIERTVHPEPAQDIHSNEPMWRPW